MLTIRLQRRGRKNDPSFRVIVVDSKKGPKTGRYLEMVGSYDARVDRIDLQGERIKYWMSEGAQVSDTVHNLLVTKGVIEGKKRNVLPRKSPPKSAEGGSASGGKEEQAEAKAETAPEVVAEEAAAETTPAEGETSA